MEDEFMGKFAGGLSITDVSPATRLLEKRRQMFEVQEALEIQKGDFERKESIHRRREDALKGKDLELQESLIKFNRFLQENENKRSRALKRANDERKLREQKETELHRLQEQLKERMQEEAGLQATVEMHRRYLDYLQRVVDSATEDYTEVNDLLSRYQRLKDTNQDLLQGQAEGERQAGRSKEEFTTYVKGRSNDILNQNNAISVLQKELERGGRGVVALSSELDNKMRNLSDRTLEMGQVLTAVANVFERCSRSSAVRRAGHASSKGEWSAGNQQGHLRTAEELGAAKMVAADRLDNIGDFLVDLKGIVSEFNSPKMTEQQQQQVQQQ